MELWVGMYSLTKRARVDQNDKLLPSVLRNHQYERHIYLIMRI